MRRTDAIRGAALLLGLALLVPALPVDAAGDDADASPPATGGRHSLVLSAEGEVYAFGAGERGQLGLGSVEARPRPVRIEALSSARRISAGGEHSVVLDADGRAYGFGANESGQLGVGDRLDRLTPEPVASSVSWREVQSIAARERHTTFFVERWGGQQWSYSAGLGDNGRLGKGRTDTELRPRPSARARELVVTDDSLDDTGPLSGSLRPRSDGGLFDRVESG